MDTPYNIKGFFYPVPSYRLRPKLQGGTMKKLFLTLALVMCWAVTALAAGQINGLTLDNVEEKLVYQNTLNRGTWSPQLAQEDPAATWYSLSRTTAVVAGHEAGAKKISRIQFFVSKDERIPSEDGRRMQFISDISCSALTAAGLCIPKFDRDKKKVGQFLQTMTLENPALFREEKATFTASGYQFTAAIIKGVYTIWAEKK